MGFKCTLVWALLVAADAATIHLKPIDVPVKVVYGEEDYSIHSAEVLGIRNVNEKTQLSPEEIAQLSHMEENKSQTNPNSIKNLDAKIQLSHQDLLKTEEHLPFSNLKSNVLEETETENLTANSSSNDIESVTSEEYVSSTEFSKPDTTAIEEKTTLPSSTAIVSTSEGNRQDLNFVLLIQIAQTIVWSGLDSMRETIDNLSTNEEPDKKPPISAEQWNTLNQTISDIFAALVERGSLKSGNENVLQNIVDGVQRTTDNFIKHLRSPQRAAVSQKVIGVVSFGFQRITKNLNSISSRSTSENVVSDYTTTPPRPLMNVINKMQQLFEVSPLSNSSHEIQDQTEGASFAPQPVNRIEQDGNKTIPYEVLNSSSNAQADAPTTSNPFQSLQQVASQFGQAIGNFNPFNQLSTAAPGSQGDVPPDNSPFQPFQQVANQVGQVINNLNPFNRPSTTAPGLQDDSTTNNPFQVFQQAVNQVGQTINNLNPFNRPSTTAPDSQGDDPTTNNPLQAFQQVASQVSQAINNLNPFNRPSTVTSETQEDTSATNNPLQSIQQAANQVGQVINNLNPFNRPSTAAPGAQGDAPSTSSSFQPIQEVANQVGQAINNLNPLKPGGTATSATQNEGSTNAPLQGIQTVVDQVGQTVSGLNPLNPGSNSTNALEGVQSAINQVGQTVSSSNPLESIQNAVNQAGQPASNLNPLNQNTNLLTPPNNPSEGVQNAINQAGDLAFNLNPLNQGPSTTRHPAEDVQDDENQPLSSLAPLNGESSTPSGVVGSPLQNIPIISGNPAGAVLVSVQGASKADGEEKRTTAENKTDEELLVATD